MSEDIAKYKRLVESAYTATPVTEDAANYDQLVKDTADLIAHVYSKSPDKDAIKDGIMGHAEHHEVPDPHKFAKDVTGAVLDKIRAQ